MSASIELIFFYNFQRIDRFKFSFWKEPKNINKKRDIYPIPDSEFKYGKDKSQMKILLYKQNSNEYKEYDFNIYYSKNTAYIQLDGLFLKSYEIILRSSEENLRISSLMNYEFTEFDSMENRDKKRLVLINYGETNLFINKEPYDLSDIIHKNCEIESSSYQISEIDLQDNKFIVKPFILRKECNIEFLKKNKDLYQNFAQDLEKLFYSNDNDYITNLTDINIKYNELANYDLTNFHKTNEYLSKLFELNDFLDTKFFLNFFKCLYFYEYIDDFINKRTITQCFIDKIKDIFEDFENNNKIPIYEKIRALNALFFTNGNLEDLNQLNSLNIKCYIIPEKLENSILDKVVKFFNNYIEGINENSVIYENLLLIDGGHGYYNKERVYTYDLTNLKMIKNHLKDIFPKVLVFCYIENDEVAFTTPEFQGIVINEFHLLKNYKEVKGIKNIDYNNPYCLSFNEEMQNDIAMNIVLDLMHEVNGHKKFGLTETEVQSPKKIINKKKEIIELKHVSEFNPNVNDDNEYILTSTKPKGDSGHFFELGYGKIDNILITRLLFYMKNKGKLINRWDLFLDSGEKLKKYVYLRKFIEKKNIEFDFNNNMTIEDEIKQMDLLIANSQKEEDKNEINIFMPKSQEEEKEKNEFLTKKRKDKIIDKSLDNQEIKKKDNLNLMKFYEIKEQKNVDKKDNNSEKEEKLTLVDRVKNKTRKEIIEMSRKRVMEKFKFKYDEKLRFNMIQKLQELKPDDPYYYDLIFFISDLKKTV